MSDPILCAIGDDCRGRVMDHSKKPPEEVQLPPRDVYDRGVICGPCRHRLEHWIGDLPALHDALVDALIPGNGASGGQPSYRNAWPVNPAALGDHEFRFAFDIWGKLAGWGRIIVEERGINPPGRWIYVRPPIGHEGPAQRQWDSDVDVARLAAWLTIHTDWIAHREWVPVMYAEISELRWTVRCAAYPDRQRRRFPLPRHRRQCPDCHADMYAIVTGETHAGTMVQCSGCGREWLPTEWFRLGRRILATQTRRSA